MVNRIKDSKILEVLNEVKVHKGEVFLIEVEKFINGNVDFK